ncbi:MAG: ORF6N domain-containing protein [Erysipelotrichales bacterium]|nr:ORF6N domain-containing protein [Erysipelotrichales bacterium]
MSNSKIKEIESVENIKFYKEFIESKIYDIRGQKVMLDFELAEIYNYSTKNFNRQVNNNINKFPNDFRFQLSKEEVDEISRCKNCTSIMQTTGTKGGRSYLPYAFTEQGIYMLMTVLKGDVATKQSISIIRTFKSMKDYIMHTHGLLPINEMLKIVNRVDANSKALIELKNENEIIKDTLKIVMDNFIDPNIYKHFLLLDGNKIEADNAYQSIYKLANNSIYIIDDYIDIKTLELLKICKENIKIIIFSDNKSRNSLTNNFVLDFKNDTNLDIIFKRTNGKCHDRYIIIDYETKNENIFHSGALVKDAGNRITTITKIEDKNVYHSMIDSLLLNQNYNI